MSNVMILSAGRRVELVQAFRHDLQIRGLASKIVTTDLRPELSAACQVADVAIRSPRVTDPAYPGFLLEHCTKHAIALVVPTIDTELLVLAQYREAFAQQGVHLVISDEALVRQCRDKRLTADLFVRMGIAVPRIFSRDAIEFPCFAKPYDGSCSIGAALLPHVQALSGAMLADEKMMFMEYIDGSHSEFTVDAYYDKHGRLRCCVPRQRLETRAGEVSKGVTRKGHVYAYLRDKLERLDGARGCITVQLFANADTGRYAALEINPRFGGGFPLSHSAGAHYPGWLIDEYLLGREVPFKDDWAQDLLMLRYDAKVLVHGHP
jgi:carbamoyl-phosphate synthase large subunit